MRDCEHKHLKDMNATAGVRVRVQRTRKHKHTNMCFAVSGQRSSFPQVPVSERCRLSVVFRVCESLASVQDVLLVFLRPKSVIEVHVEKTAHESDTAHGQQECEAQSRRAHYEYGNARASAQFYFASLLTPNTPHTSHTQLSRTIHAHTLSVCCRCSELA